MDFIFSTREFWLEMNIPKSIVRKKFVDYFGDKNTDIENRDEAIEFLSKIITDIQNKMVTQINEVNASDIIKNLYKIFDECFHFYMRQKKNRQELSELNINSGGIVDTFELNRNISKNVIDAVNVWLENAVLLQTNLDKDFDCESFNVDYNLFIDMYVYGLVSQAISLLHMSKKFNDKEMYYGIKITPHEAIPVELLKYHPIIYYNTLLTGNQNIFNTDKDLKYASSSEFGKGFCEEYGVNFLYFLAVLNHFKRNILFNGQVALTVIDKNDFIREIETCTNPKVKAESIMDNFVLTKKVLTTQVRKKEPIIWVMGTNKYRHELRPFICLDNNRIVISYCALDQSINLWVSMFSNGGMCYTNAKDKLTTAIEKRNDELSKKLVDILREKLRNHYISTFDEIEVNYDRVFGSRDINYGDYDLVFYSKEEQELFLIEAKFFSDSLNNSGIISDYEKLFKEDGYYDRCRRRYDLFLEEPDKMKSFVGAEGQINVHMLFVSSKPLEVEFQDKEQIVCFPCLSIFDKYIEGKLICEEGDIIMRPSHLIQ